MKPISYKKKNWGHRKDLYSRAPESCSVLIQGTGQLWLWQLPFKMEHNAGSIWRTNIELKVFLKVLDLSLV